MLPCYIWCFFLIIQADRSFLFRKFGAKRRAKWCCYSWFFKVRFFEGRHFLWVCFYCWLGRSYKIIFHNCIRNRFFASDKLFINKFFNVWCFWPTSGLESTKSHTSSLYTMSALTLINESFKNWLVRSHLPITVVWSFLNIALCTGLSSWWWVSFLLETLSALLSTCYNYSAISDSAMSHLLCNSSIHDCTIHEID